MPENQEELDVSAERTSGVAAQQIIESLKCAKKASYFEKFLKGSYLEDVM